MAKQSTSLKNIKKVSGFPRKGFSNGRAESAGGKNGQRFEKKDVVPLKKLLPKIAKPHTAGRRARLLASAYELSQGHLRFGKKVCWGASRWTGANTGNRATRTHPCEQGGEVKKAIT